MNKFIKYWSPVILYSGVLFVLSSFSTLPGQELIPYLDKIEHLTAYMILSFLFYRAWLGTTDYKEYYCIILAIFCTIAYGASDEFHQSFVSGRDASLGDLLADSIGAIIFYTSLFNKIRGKIKDESRMSKV